MAALPSVPPSDAAQSISINDLFESHLKWAEQVARSVHRGLPPSFDLDDLKQAARIELWRQVQRFDEARRVPFQAFAYPAVRGAVLMLCRRRHWRDTTAVELRENYVDGRPQPDELMIQQEDLLAATSREEAQLAKIREAMRNLPTIEAYLVLRVYFGDCDVDGLAPRGRKTLRAAVLELRRMLRPTARDRVSSLNRTETQTCAL